MIGQPRKPEHDESAMVVHGHAIPPRERVPVTDEPPAAGGACEAGIRPFDRLGVEGVGCESDGA